MASTTVTVVNQGSAAVKVSQVSLAGQSFTVSGAGDLPITVAAGGSLNLGVSFSPASTGTATGELMIASDAAANGALVIGLSGSGTTAGAPELSINATSIAFGNVNLNASATQSLTLSSSGTAGVTVSSATVTGSGFSISSATLPLTLNSSQTTTISVQFDPTVARPASGTLTIVSTSLTNPIVTIGLSGTGVGVLYEVNLDWIAPTSSTDPAAGYNVYRSPDGASSYQQLNTTILTQTNYSDTTVQDGLSYDYIVESVDASGVESAPSNTATVVIP